MVHPWTRGEIEQVKYGTWKIKREDPNQICRDENSVLRWKYILDGINCRYALLVKRLVNLKTAIETIQNKSHKEEILGRWGDLWWAVFFLFKWTNIRVIGVIEGEGITKGICEEVMAEIFLNLMKNKITVPRNSVSPKHKYYTEAHHNQIA